MTFVLFTIGVLAFYLGHMWGTAITATLIRWVKDPEKRMGRIAARD